MTPAKQLHQNSRALALLARQIDRQQQQATQHTSAEDRAHAERQMKRLGHEVWAAVEGLRPVLAAAADEGWLSPAPPPEPTEEGGG